MDVPKPVVETGVLMWIVLTALTVQAIIRNLRDGGYFRRAVQWWRNRKPVQDKDYGLDDDATVERFMDVLAAEHEHEPEPPKQIHPLLHHTGEQPQSRLTATVRVLGLLDPLDGPTEPMPDGVHGYRIGQRPVQPVMTRTESTPPAVLTPIYDALVAELAVRDLDLEWLAFSWEQEMAVAA
jgi:hypothetical protein